MPVIGVPQNLKDVLKNYKPENFEITSRRHDVYYFKSTVHIALHIRCTIGNSITFQRVLNGSTDIVEYNVLTNKVTHIYKWSGYKTIKYEFDLAKTEEEQFMFSTVNPANYPDLNTFLLILNLYHDTNNKAKEYARIMYERQKERDQKSYEQYNNPYVKYSKVIE